MTYTIFYSNAGAPATGLVLSWNSMHRVDTAVAYIPQPVIDEIGHGWYKFDWFDAFDVVGVIDGGVALPAADRYKPVRLSPRDSVIASEEWL